MQLLGIFDVEDADVRAVPDYPRPRLHPDRVDADVHSDVEQHEVTSPAQQAPH